MQNMMKNLMGDMWKGVGDMNAENLMKDMWKGLGDMNTENWMKDISSANSMDPKKIGLQILDFQKSAFDNACNSMQQTQQQVEKMADPLLKNIPGLPEEWKSMLKKNQDDMRKTVDESFAKVESYFAATSNPVKETKSAAAEAPTEKTSPKAK
jgi:hypothetical protein